MKVKIPVIAISALFVAVIALGGCSEKTITLKTYEEPVEIHNERQIEYLNSAVTTRNPANLDSSIDGKTEYSRPIPVTLEWSDTAKAGEYRIEISESSTFKTSLTYTSETTSADIYNLKIATKYYWRVTNETTSVTSQTGTFSTVDYGPRNMYVDGVTNVRDMGGWVTSSGDRIAQGLIYRGARLNNTYSQGYNTNEDGSANSKNKDKYCVLEKEITAEGEKVFKEIMGIKTEIDLRTLNSNGYSDAIEAEGIYSVVDGVNYVGMPMNNSGYGGNDDAIVKQLFTLLADESNYPVYFHCNIGTNRTGFIAYLLGGLCGMEENDLYIDYMFSDFGTIALPTPLSADRYRTELSELTSDYLSKTVNLYTGATVAAKVESYLESCGISADTYNAVREIMLG